MTGRPLKDINCAPVKLKEITVQMPERQALALEHYCAAHGLTADAVVLAALCAMVEGFDEA